MPMSVEQAHGLDHFVGVPRIAVRIAERHRDVGHDVEPGVVGLLLDLLQHVEASSSVWFWLFFRKVGETE